MATPYPEWKIIVWRYVRVFLASFLVALPIDNLFYVNPDVAVSFVRSAIVAGLIAMFKSIRDEFGKEIPIVNKLPL